MFKINRHFGYREHLQNELPLFFALTLEESARENDSPYVAAESLNNYNFYKHPYWRIVFLLSLFITPDGLFSICTTHKLH